MEKRFTLAINYRSIILDAITKMKILDNVDFYLIIEEFTRTTGIRFYGDYSLIGDYDEYIEFKSDGIISLKDGINLDTKLEGEEYTILDKLLEGVDPRVKEFFDSFDIAEYSRKKGEFLQSDRLLNEANVLLISDIPEDYQGLKRIGFKNIDYFKSIIKADEYFNDNPAKLESYHLILIGNQEVQNCCFYSYVDLEGKIDELTYKTNPIQIYIKRKKFNDRIAIETQLRDRKNNKHYQAQELTIEAFYKRIIENMIINEILNQPGFNPEPFTPHIDYINPNRFIPQKRKDLKILFLDSFHTDKVTSLIVKELGLNITFKEDSNYSLGMYVKSHLGDYDIIIASNLFSNSILGMNVESTEQCKSTGRELTLLMTYGKELNEQSENLGDILSIRYSYGGNLAPNYLIMHKRLGVLNKKLHGTLEFETEFRLREYLNMKSIIESSIMLYNEALKKKNRSLAGEADFKTVAEINDEHIYALTVSEEQKSRELEPIIAFDNIRQTVIDYLKFRSKKLTKKSPEGIKFIDVKGGIQVLNIINGQVVCTLTFKREYKEEGLRVFTLETINKRGVLSAPEVVGLYTSVYDGKENVPPRPNTAQLNALSSIEKKIAYAVKPINDEVTAKLGGEEKHKIRKLTNNRKEGKKNE